MAEETELSEREREILRLVATGASNKEIARLLVISPNTVKVHLRNIFSKVGVASRTEATLFAIKTGLMAAPNQDGALPPAAFSGDPASALAQSIPGGQALPSQTAAIRRLSRAGWLAVLLLSLLTLAVLSGLVWRGLQPGVTASASPAAPTRMPSRWSARAAPPASLKGLAGAAYDGSLFITGGEDAGRPSSRTWRYHPATNRWETRAAKPTPVSQAQAVLLGEKIYLPGGRLADGSLTRSLEVYDPRGDRWEERAPLPAPLSGYALAALEGRLYLFGGWDGQAAVDSVYMYDPGDDAWSSGAPLTSPRAFAAAAVSGGKILLAGGFDGQKALSTVEFYFPARDQAGEKPWEPAASLPQPRYAMGAAALADVVYLVGGQGAPDLPPLEYLPQENRWVSFDPPPADPGSAPLLLSLETHLYALGSGSHQAYQAIYNLVFPLVQP